MKYSYSIIFLSLIFACVNQQNDEVWLRQIVGGKGDKILAFVYEEAGKQGLLDTNENVILIAQFDYIEDWQVDGLILVDSGGQRIDGGDVIGYEFNKYGIINTSGKVLFRPKFDNAIIRNKSIMVQIDSLWGYLDSNGNWIIKPKYKNASPFYKGTAIIQENDKYYLINKEAELVNQTPFDEIWGFKNNISVVVMDQKYGFINYSGNFILPLDYYNGIGEFNWYYGQFMKDRKWFVIDTSGKLAINYGFDEVSIINENEIIFAQGMVNGVSKKVELNKYFR